MSNFTRNPDSGLPVTYSDPGATNVSSARRGDLPHHERVSVLVCQGCRQGVLVIEELRIGETPASQSDRLEGPVSWQGIYWWPTPGMNSGSPDVPAAVAEAIAEAERCLSVRAQRAAVVMLRGALAEIVTVRGSQDAKQRSSLAGQLKRMVADGALTSDLADWAHHIRLLGNAGAHPNELEPVTLEEARELSRLTDALVEYLFVQPARVRRMREGRAGR